MKSQIRVSLDGKSVLNASMGSYDAPPWTLEIGRNDISMSQARMAFSGKILSVKRLAPAPPEKDIGSNGLWRIRCIFPMQAPLTSNFPVLAWGVTGNGTLLYVNILSGNRVRFGLDEWGYGGGFTGPVTIDPLAEHSIEVFIGTLAGRASWPSAWHVNPDKLRHSAGKLQIWMDGQLVHAYDIHLPYSPLSALIDVGANGQGFSTSPPIFDGPIKADPFSNKEQREFLERNLKSVP
jgi:hypothetical protein